MEVNPLLQENPTINPYAPTVEVAGATDDDSIRREHLNNEAAVQAMGILYLALSLIWIPMGLFTLYAATTYSGNANLGGPTIAAFFYLAFGSLQLWIGIGLRKLRPASRRLAIGFSILGLLAIPVGTLIAAYFLYLLFCKKGKFVFTERYQQIIAATPHIKYTTSALVWVLGGLLGILVVGGMLASIFLA
ncbi:MAG: hypothetical protein AB8B91_07335 [Rubripirellula sp.]